MAIRNGKYMAQYKILIENISPLNIGGDEGKPLINEETNEAVIPGTGMAGAFRAYLSRVLDSKEISELFGEDSLSRIFIYDSFSKVKGYEIRPAVRINGFTGAVDNGKFDRYLISEGHEFDLKAEVYADSIDEMKKYESYLGMCVKALDNGDIQLGSFKSTGIGVFRVCSVKRREFDCTDKKGLFRYLKNINSERDFKDVKISECDVQSGIVSFELKGELKTPLLISGYSSLDYRRADNEQMRDAYGNPIIPGSSLKGVIRAEAQKIFDLFKKPQITEFVFGNSIDNRENRKASHIVVMDSVIENSKTVPYNRIKIDKFTGGVMKSALAEDEPVTGSVRLCVKYRLQDDEQINESTIAVLSSIFRDIAIGNLPIGGGNNIGRGRIDGELLRITRNSEVIFKRDYKKAESECDKLAEYYKVLNEEGCI